MPNILRLVRLFKKLKAGNARYYYSSVYLEKMYAYVVATASPCLMPPWNPRVHRHMLEFSFDIFASVASTIEPN